ncbi:CMRF35-like molecule 1 isoform X1 [Pangasianodon hypophthalmus]|uniref:CMRF35-like molecule 1 isoform X1 n=1 Tax=Pangasianodon hypophthalmus TaxID=310915 RepID=UPI002307726F|nr:CMRF35-like molecule 1 isoform X1 [Pangasianodon hypophthalmus]XP_053083420.1 CMRF35-like molecule 1 isoform X1 [Pangasianodon hypophthalmus]
MCCFFIFILFISCAVCQASRQFSIKTGESVTIPCRYDRKYIQHKKYWCYGGTFNFCTIQAYANNTKGKVTVTDYPAESLFTVTVNNLQTGNTGWYWCAVEISGPDVREYLYITVKSDPDLSVMESRVRGEEGGNITVQCFYSAAYQNTQKQWCRFKDGRCNSVGRTATSQNSAVNISDDGRRSFSVQMSGLKKSDAGWYWCSAGDLQVPVHISVNNSTVFLNVTTNTDQQKDNSVHEMMSLWLLVAVGLGLLLILVSIVTYMFRKTCKKENQTRTRKKSNDAAAHTPSSAVDHEGDVTYSSVFYATKNQTQSLRVKDDEVTYSKMNSPPVRDDEVTCGNVHSLGDRDNEVTYSTVVRD